VLETKRKLSSGSKVLGGPRDHVIQRPFDIPTIFWKPSKIGFGPTSPEVKGQVFELNSHQLDPKFNSRNVSRDEKQKRCKINLVAMTLKQITDRVELALLPQGQMLFHGTPPRMATG
jgi:hypothetical protein